MRISISRQTVKPLIAFVLLIPVSVWAQVRLVRYTVLGTADRASITYVSGKGESSQIANAILPWVEIVYLAKGDFVSLSAQNAGEEGSVEVDIDYKSLSHKQAEMLTKTLYKSELLRRSRAMISENDEKHRDSLNAILAKTDSITGYFFSKMNDFKSARSVGAFVIASASGTLP